MNSAHRRRLWRCFISFGLIGMLAFASVQTSLWINQWLEQRSPFNKIKIASAIGPDLSHNRFPPSLRLAHFDGDLQLEYTIDAHLQESMEKLIRSYSPDWAAFVALDVHTGKILSMNSYTHGSQDQENLALKATFPAASVFKIVTAAAAVDSKQFSAETVIPFNGRHHTLYKNNVKFTDSNRWTRYYPLRKSFGLSINTVFGKLGMNVLGRELLLEYAERFGFNKQITSDIPLQTSEVRLSGDGDDQWEVAETASGFTRNNTLSPIHGAMLAAAIANEGMMMQPYVVESIRSSSGGLVYRTRPEPELQSIEAHSAQELQAMMEETIKSGTSRSIFRRFSRSKKYGDITVGGKTGSLTGTDPKGKCDWFVGYAKRKGQSIAFAALTIHKEFWKVRSAYLAKKFVEEYFERYDGSPHDANTDVAADL